MSDERGSGFDPGADDWLAEEGRIVWLDEREPEPGAPPAGRQAPGEETAMEPGGISRLDVIRRRRIVALVALGAVLVVVIAVPVVVLGGGNGKKTTTTTPPATTTPPTTTAPPTTTQAPPTLKLVLPASGSLRRGDTGAQVKTLQQGLIALGDLKGTADGNFGSQTEAAVAAFQQANGLTADGVVGAKTAAKLNAQLAAQNVPATTG